MTTDPTDPTEAPALELRDATVRRAFFPISTRWPLPLHTPARGHLTVDAFGLRLDGVEIARRESIREGRVIPRAHGLGAVVELDRGWFHRGPIEIETVTVADARAILSALGVAPTHRTAAFSLQAASINSFRARRSILVMITVGLVVAMLLLRVALATHASPDASLLLVVLCAILGGGLLITGPRATVGADGVSVEALGLLRFHRLADIVRTEVIEQGEPFLGAIPTYLRIHLRSGAPANLVVGASSRRGRQHQLLQARGRAIVLGERIDEALAAAERTEVQSRAEAESILARSARRASEWMKELRQLPVRTQTFRAQGALAVKDLYRVVEDPIASHEARAAAAVALTPHLDDAGRTRVRIAADATAAPKLRIALLAAVASDDDNLEKALEALAQD